MEFEGKVALITGGSSGIGRAIAHALAKEGASIALLARTKSKLESVQNEIESYGEIPVSLEETETEKVKDEIEDAWSEWKKRYEKEVKKQKLKDKIDRQEMTRASICACDVTDMESVKRAVEKFYAVFGRIDFVINNAGLGIFRPVQDIEEDEWDIVIDTVLKGTFLVTKFAIPYLYKQGSGHIINIASLWAKKVCKECSAYTAAKYGVRGFSDSIREEARDYNVKVSTVMPGTVATPFFENGEWKDFDPSAALKPEDVAKAVLDALKYSENASVEEIVVQTVKPRY